MRRKMMKIECRQFEDIEDVLKFLNEIENNDNLELTSVCHSSSLGFIYVYYKKDTKEQESEK